MAQDLDLQVKKDFVTGFIGENGAGKLITIKMTMNLLKPDAGEVKIFDLHWSDFHPSIQYINIKQFNSLSYQNILLIVFSSKKQLFFNSRFIMIIYNERLMILN